MRAIEAIGWVLACRNTTLLQIDLSGNQATERLVSRIQVRGGSRRSERKGE